MTDGDRSWIVSVSVFVLVVFATVGIWWWIRNHIPPTPAPPTKYTAPLVWSKGKPSTDKDKNTCQLYQFPTAIVNLDGFPVAVPGNPTFNTEILNGLQGNSTYPECLDNDQLVAQQLQHTCIAPNGVIEGAIVKCITTSGGITGLGGQEDFYSSVNCYNVPPCLGQLSLLSINFQVPNNPNIVCLQRNNSVITANGCNPSINEQLFRITRVDPGQDPGTLKPGQGQNGLFAQILDRDSGMCVTVSNEDGSTVYDPRYAGITGCSGPTGLIGGLALELQPCVGVTGTSGGTGITILYPGYVWAAIPSLDYCSSTGGCTAGNTLTTPPQITFVGNLPIENIPLGTGYNGYTGSSAVVQWLIDNNAQSMYYGGGGGNVIMQPFGTNVKACNQQGYVAQYTSIPQFNTIIQQAVCRVQQQEQIPVNAACTSL
jgi:hypothetical protein